MVIEPLTNTYTPLADSKLKRDILAMASRAGVPADNVYTDDASRQSRRLNGHVSGAFGTARITIDDTALTSSPEAVKALAAHEMGHYVMHHPFKMVLFGTLVAMLGFAFIARLEPPLTRRMGARWGVADVTQTGAIAVFWLLFTAWGFVSDPLTNAYARAHETQADAFSLALAQEPTGLADFMIQDADIGPLQPTTAAKVATCSVAAGVILLTAADRVFLGVHYPSDVVAGILLGTAMAGASAIGYLGWSPTQPASERAS
jgi:STE24 endopeptidase